MLVCGKCAPVNCGLLAKREELRKQLKALAAATKAEKRKRAQLVKKLSGIKTTDLATMCATRRLADGAQEQPRADNRMRTVQGSIDAFANQPRAPEGRAPTPQGNDEIRMHVDDAVSRILGLQV